MHLFWKNEEIWKLRLREVNIEFKYMWSSCLYLWTCKYNVYIHFLYESRLFQPKSKLGIFFSGYFLFIGCTIPSVVDSGGAIVEKNILSFFFFFYIKLLLFKNLVFQADLSIPSFVFSWKQWETKTRNEDNSL